MADEIMNKIIKDLDPVFKVAEFIKNFEEENDFSTFLKSEYKKHSECTPEYFIDFYKKDLKDMELEVLKTDNNRNFTWAVGKLNKFMVFVDEKGLSELGGAETKIILTEDDQYILSIESIKKAHDYFNGDLFENMPFSQFMDCFNLSKKPKHPKLKKVKDFVYFLSEAGLNEKIASERFGVKGYANQKSRLKHLNPPKAVFINQIKSILKK